MPTEIWRETVDRRQRYRDIRQKMESGEIESINDLITYNLDIRQFAQDVVENCEGPELLYSFWSIITGNQLKTGEGDLNPGITVLDPACGSGAFLFAALNILEPLYEACIEKMSFFLRNGAVKGKRTIRITSNFFQMFLSGFQRFFYLFS